MSPASHNSYLGPILNPYYDLYCSLQDQAPAFQLELRKKLIWAYSWAIPSEEILREIAQYSPILELGAGTGYWAWLLRQAGARVTAFDIEPQQPPRWCPIGLADHKIVREYPSHTLFLCWPPYENSMAIRSLRAFSGSQLIYIGEWEGRTADYEFHKILLTNWELVREIKIPNWPGFSDQVFVFRRNQETV
jgi:hypothetical protein